MGGGVHHERPRSQDRISGLINAEESDREWILAAALLDSLAEDLALTFAARWWRLDPCEMERVCHEASILVKELRSQSVQMLHDLITSATEGRVKPGLGWLIRLAKGKAASYAISGKNTSFVAVQKHLRATLVARGNTKHKDMPPTRLPNGRFNPAYQAERKRRIQMAEEMAGK